ncbi:MAG: beta-ketoacyl synthase N-terminal-like domain-containing protein [Desulfobacteraceae bacterium]
MNDSVFKVQTRAEEWLIPNGSDTRRCAVSAFGFGGINAHVLIEEYRENNIKFLPVSDPGPEKEAPVAVVGMEILTGGAKGLEEFVKLALGEDANMMQARKPGKGLFMDELPVQKGEFSIPPNQMSDLLSNQVLMLKAAKNAMADAGITPRPGKEDLPRTGFGAAVGIEFDFRATDFHTRWKAKNEEQDEIPGSPLTSTRTLGALGGIVASRIAREFKLGGPCFTVSAGAASGIKALDVGVDSIRSGRTDIFLCGCVDMASDNRQYALNHALIPFAGHGRSIPFDDRTRGPLGSEGACAVVLKPLDRAVKEKDRIYCVIQGSGKSSAGDIAGESREPGTLGMEKAFSLSLERALDSASVSMDSIDLYQAHACGDKLLDDIEADALNKCAQNSKKGFCAVASASGLIGDTAGASGLASFIAAAASVFSKTLYPIPGYARPGFSNWNKERFHIPAKPCFWVKTDKKSTRHACIGTMTKDGGCAHVIIKEHAFDDRPPEKRFAADFNNRSIFLLKGKNTRDLLLQIDELQNFAKKEPCVFEASRKWYLLNRDAEKSGKLFACVIADNRDNLEIHLQQARRVVTKGQKSELYENQGVVFEPSPLGLEGKTAFLYPGSGNHFPGMSRELGTLFPDFFSGLEKSGASLYKMLQPELFYPLRVDWNPGWKEDTADKIRKDIHAMIFSQVSFGLFMTRIADRFNLRPKAALGHSLGESASLFSLGVWQDPEEMLRRMEKSTLFTRQLGGEYSCAKKHWGIPAHETVNWTVALVNRSKAFVDERIRHYPRLYRLIVNTPEETVIGGEKTEVKGFIKNTGCGARFLDGVVSVHCPVAEHASQAYFDLHRFECARVDGIDFYSCFTGRPYTPETDTAAKSILDQALYGFDFPEMIRNAYADGVRLFVEMGPGASCTRLVKTILKSRDFSAMSLSSPAESCRDSLRNAMASLWAHGVDIDIAPFFRMEKSSFPHEKVKADRSKASFTPRENSRRNAASLINTTAKAHEKFLDLTQKNLAAIEENFSTLCRLASHAAEKASGRTQSTAVPGDSTRNKVLFNREMCMEFAVGKAANVLGEKFKEVDEHPVRVRLPDEPLMLVDRILSIEGEMLSLSPGKIITQHDVKQDAWYLDGGCAPVSITIEAGQADLFLCSYLGIDHAVKGTRKYRLLDAKVTFHRSLPRPGETIEFHIEIDRFLKQQDVYLFFFHYKGYIGNELLISMRDGCAGFFTEAEVENSKGIILKSEELEQADPLQEPLKPFADLETGSFDDRSIDALRQGDLETAFGNKFKGLFLGKHLRLPSGRLHLIDRVTHLDPYGGRFGLGSIKAEADIKPDAWFLTCHFIDDMVMPGTLMYECCSHALRIFTLRMGWISSKDSVYYDTIPGVESDLKCRGPVTPDTVKAGYFVEIKKIGYMPEPYAIADAHMYADDLRIVHYKNMGIRIAGLTGTEIEQLWS